MISIYSNNFILIYSCVIFFIMGTVLGSFLNCVASRIKEGMPWWKGRSKCDNCGHKLGILDLFPIISYLINKGKCRYCGTKISIKYLITEVVLGLLFLTFILIYGYLDINLINYLGLISILFGLSLTDLDTYIIPDGFIIFGIVWWLSFSIIDGNNLNTIFTSSWQALIVPFFVFLLSLIMDDILKKESMGGGDVKLLFLVGLYLGLYKTMLCLILSCVLGLIFIGIKNNKETQEIPFCPAISLATYFCLLFGSSVISWYFDLFF